MPSPHHEQRTGIFCALAAHTLWGLFPLFWNLLGHVGSVELVCHRIVWSFVCLIVVVPWLAHFGKLGGSLSLRQMLGQPRMWLIYAAAAGLIAINWFAFIWAVNHDRVLEASLGYYINPLLNVSLGVIFLGERLGKVQWAAVGSAATGVLVMTIAGGGLPWVSLAMAASFAFYGLVKKQAPLPVMAGLLLETTVLALPAAGFLVWAYAEGEGAFLQQDWLTDVLLLMCGVITITPLALFATAARRVPLSLIGILQYVGPTLQFLVGTLIFGEPFAGWRIVGFVFVWIGLLLYLSQTRRTPRNPPAEVGDELVVARHPAVEGRVSRRSS
jgi:chloramphenicol-sensitive protein RarD